MKFSEWHVPDIAEYKVLEGLDKKIKYRITADIKNNDIIVENCRNAIMGNQQYNTVSTHTYGG